jgi:hypothetical protein
MANKRIAASLDGYRLTEKMKYHKSIQNAMRPDRAHRAIACSHGTEHDVGASLIPIEIGIAIGIAMVWDWNTKNLAFQGCAPFDPDRDFDSDSDFDPDEI